MKTTVLFLIAVTSITSAADPIVNPLIDYPKFEQVVQQTKKIRETRRVTEAQFLELAAQPGTLILDARSADKYRMRHVKGAINLPFTDSTEQSLAQVIPEKTTRVLIYCNNNFAGAPVSLAAKRMAVPLNVPTYISLTAYGYTNVYELGPLLDVATTKLEFVGSEVK